MKRRKFLALSTLLVGASGTLKALAADAKKDGAAKKAGAVVADKDILREGKPAAVASYCEHPEKQPNKFCPTKPAGVCSDCTFYNKPESKGKTKDGKEVAKCQLLATAPQYVFATAACATFVKKP